MAARVRAPELEAPGATWVRGEPATLAQLRGRPVLLDFWTSGCVNCQRVAEELRGLERRFPDLVVLGIHSPKFPHERDAASVAAAADRLRLDHPVLSDPGRVLWDAYAVRAWPTLVLVDPDGYVALTVAGEGRVPELAVALGTVPTRSPEGMHRKPAPLRDHVGTDPTGSFLAFPGGVAAGDGRIAVADTGNDRVLEVAADGEVLAEHGGLYQPHGVRYDDDGALLVCETGADRLVRVDRAGGRSVVAEELRSPWDVVRWQGHLVVAEAGTHRLVGIDAAGEVQVVAGRAFAEELVDGPAHRALLAQPSGVAVTATGDLAFVDAESSALRVLGARTLEVTTLVGRGLFTSGADDGDGERARLQHPLGLASAPDGALYVADTYNGLLRVWRGRHLWTVPVEGFAEPGAVDVLPGGTLVVADTGNHRVVVVDPHADPAVAVAIDVGRTVAAPAILAPGDPLPLPAFGHGDLDGPGAVRIVVRSALLDEPVELTADIVPEALDLDLAEGAGRVVVDLELATCTPAVCRLERVHHAVDVIVG